MEWIIKIENEPKQRILVKFDPQNELLIFIGQLKPYNKSWVDFIEFKKSFWMGNRYVVNGTTSNLSLISLEIIQETLLAIHEVMEKRVSAYQEIVEAFEHIKVIEFTNNENKEDDNVISENI